MRESDHNSRSRDRRVRREPCRQVARQSRRRRVPRRLRDRLRDDSVGGVRAAALDAPDARAVRALALDDRRVRLRPHVHVRERDAVARRAVSADELDGRPRDAVDDVAVPVLLRESGRSAGGEKGGEGHGRTEKVMLDSCTPAPVPGVWDAQYWLTSRPYAVPREMKESKTTFLT